MSLRKIELRFKTDFGEKLFLRDIFEKVLIFKITNKTKKNSKNRSNPTNKQI